MQTPFAVKAKPITNATGKYTGVVISWTYPTSGVPFCPATGSACLSGFQIKDTTTGKVIATTTQLGTGARSFTYTPSPMWKGSQCFSVAAAGLNPSGGALMVAAATTPCFNSK